jgi:hypothetical protein
MFGMLGSRDTNAHQPQGLTSGEISSPSALSVDKELSVKPASFTSFSLSADLYAS